MDTCDAALDEMVRTWVRSQPASVSISQRGGGKALEFSVTPKNSYAAPITLWVADDGEHVSCSIASGSWGDNAVPLKRGAVVELLDAVASGAFSEEVRRLFGKTVQLKGVVQLPSGARLEYGQWPGIPGLRWHQLRYEPYAAPPNNSSKPTPLRGAA